jgi:hypothetical protein
VGWTSTYAVLGLGSSSVVALASVLDRDSLLAVHRLARDQVGRGKQILLSTTSDEHALVTMGLDDDLLASGTAGLTAAAAATSTGFTG